MTKYDQKYGSIRIYILLGFSLLFYASWNPRYLLLLLWISLVDYLIAKQMHLSVPILPRKFLLFLSLGNSLGVLCLFKYLGFFQENLYFIIEFLGLTSHAEILRLLLPVGISFYIFQSISYVVDVYRREILPETNYFYYLFFLSFFPQLVAGPIVQAKQFLPQIRRFKVLSRSNLEFALFLILLGSFKKSVLADHLAVTSDFAFSHILELDREFLWWGLLSYTGQIYCDFSGYTDIALGTALIFGFQLPENFRMPYLALGFSDFWRRWHMSLSGWLRNYLYIPLGGNRLGSFRTYLNLMFVMFLGGLWHGASWNFAVWGIGHGILLSAERMTKDFLCKGKFWQNENQKGWFKLFKTVFLWAITFFLVSVLWIFFRSPKFTDSLCYLQGLFVKNGDFSIPYTQSQITFWCLIAILMGHFIGSRYFKGAKIELPKRVVRQSSVRTILLGALFSLGFIAVVLLSGNSLPFVYFVF